MVLGAGGQDVSAQQDVRRSVFRSQYMYHSKLEDGTSKLDSKKFKAAVCAASSPNSACVQVCDGACVSASAV
jgi:hypothetical protein